MCYPNITRTLLIAILLIFINSHLSLCEDVKVHFEDTMGFVDSDRTNKQYVELGGWQVEYQNQAIINPRNSLIYNRDGNTPVIKFNSSKGILKLRPAEPIRIRSDWDTINIWASLITEKAVGQVSGFRSPEITIEFFSEADKPLYISFGDLKSLGGDSDWNLYQAPRSYAKYRDRNRKDNSNNPKELHAIYPEFFSGKSGSFITGIFIKAPKKIVEGGLSIALRRLSVYRSPQVAISEPNKAQIPGLLSSGITPKVKHAYSNRVEQVGDSIFFHFNSKKENFLYKYTPSKGSLDDLSIIWNEQMFYPMYGGGISFNDSEFVGKEVDVKPKLISVSILNDRVHVEWEFVSSEFSGRYTYILRIVGRSLEIKVKEQAGLATQFKFGKFRGARTSKIDVPYLVLDGRAIFNSYQPYVLMGEDFFFFGALDWHQSDASCWNASSKMNASVYNGGSTYNPLTDGSRNPLNETLYITIASNFVDVLPDVPHRPSPHQKIYSDYYYVMTGSPYPGFVELNNQFYLNKIIYNHHFSIWGDIQKSPRMKVRVKDELHPYLKHYAKLLHEQGHLFGMHVMYTGVSPLMPLWDEAKLALTPEGYWQSDWFNLYAVDNNWLVNLYKEQEFKIHQNYNTDLYYFDTHTSRNPCQSVNFRSGIDGAGTARGGWERNARIFGIARQNGRLSISEGRRKWLYAGLCDANYGTLEGQDKPYKRLPLVDFDLLKLRPLDVTVGHLNFYGYKKKKPPKGHPSTNGKGFDQLRAFNIAFGHSSMQHGLPSENYAAFLEDYYLMRPIQSLIGTSNAISIRYSDGETEYDTSESLHKSLVADGRIHVTYANGTEIFVNYNSHHTWEFSHKGRPWVLPPFGWLVQGKNGLMGFAAIYQDVMVELMDCDDYLYIDTHSKKITYSDVEVNGSVFVNKGKIKTIIPVGRYKKFIPGTVLGEKPFNKASFVNANRRPFRHLCLIRKPSGKNMAQMNIQGLNMDGALVMTNYTKFDNKLCLAPEAKIFKYLVQ